MPPVRPPRYRPQRHLERAKVLFSYTAENDDELSIEEGEMIVVLEKDLEDSGWWKGEVKGRVGVFPDNFVELIPDQPQRPPLPAATPAASGKQKLSDKPPAPEPEKESSKPGRPKDEPKAEERGRPTPVVPAKRPVAPPPVESNNLDSIEPTEKLSNLNANRAKAPVRRPPSGVLRDKEQGEDAADYDIPPDSPRRVPVASSRRRPNSHYMESDGIQDYDVPPESPRRPVYAHRRQPNSHELEDENVIEDISPRAANRRHRRRWTNSVEEEDGEISDEPRVPASPPPRRPISVRRPQPSHQPEEEPERPLPPKTRPPPPDLKSPSSPRDSPRPDSAAHVDNSLVEDLQRQLRELRASTVSRSKYDQLSTEVQQLKESISQLKTSFKQRTLELMNEIDEEKKIRLNMQVELERVKKLVTS